MLAQNFKSADELEIKERDWKALVAVLGMLERGEILEPPADAKMTSIWAAERDLQFFDMYGTATKLDCGTAGCILGWAWKVDRWSFERGGDDIRTLFVPNGPARQCRDPSKAAVALRNYLTHGDPRWDEALGT